MKFKDKVVLITGSNSGIGKKTKEKFLENGAIVCGIDLKGEDYFVGDLSKKSDIEEYVNRVINDYGKIDIIVNNAAPISKGIFNCDYEDFLYSLKVGTVAPFYLVKLCEPFLTNGSSIINISSTRDRMSQPQTESYSAAKGAINSLTHALANSLAHKTRVNSISPGWINTVESELSNEDIEQHLVKKVGLPEDVANLILFLSSEEASFITGENICIDGGMSKQMIYHNDGWIFKSRVE